ADSPPDYPCPAARESIDVGTASPYCRPLTCLRTSYKRFPTGRTMHRQVSVWNRSEPSRVSGGRLTPALPPPAYAGGSQLFVLNPHPTLRLRSRKSMEPDAGHVEENDQDHQRENKQDADVGQSDAHLLGCRPAA